MILVVGKDKLYLMSHWTLTTVSKSKQLYCQVGEAESPGVYRWFNYPVFGLCCTVEQLPKNVMQ